MPEGSAEVQEVQVTGSVERVKMNNAGGVVALEALLDVKPGGRLLQGTAALSTTGEGNEEVSANRVEGVEVSPVSLPTRVEFTDVQYTPTEDTELELLFMGEVVATATYDELEELAEEDSADRSGVFDQDIAQLEERISRVESHIEELERESSGVGDSVEVDAVEGGTNVLFEFVDEAVDRYV